MSESDDARQRWRPGGPRPTRRQQRRARRARGAHPSIPRVEPLTPERRQVGLAGVERCREMLREHSDQGKRDEIDG